MEGVVVDQSISSYKQIKMMRRSSENILAPINYNIHGGGGVLHAPPPSLSFSYNQSSLPFDHYRYQQIQQIQRRQLQKQQQQQPPLLPLPVPDEYRAHRPIHHQSLPSLPSLPSRTRGVTRPPATRKTNIARSQSLTPKKPKSKSSKKEEAKQDFNSISECLIIASTNRWGPEPNQLPKNVNKVLSSSSSSSSSSMGKSFVGGDVGDMEKFSGSIFTLSPPPSSLPLPRFSLQPRLSCNAEAAGIDTGATDNLCRLLRLR